MKARKINLPSEYTIFNFKTRKFADVDYYDGTYRENANPQYAGFITEVRGELKRLFHAKYLVEDRLSEYRGGCDGLPGPLDQDALDWIEKYRKYFGIVEIKYWVTFDNLGDKSGFNYVLFNSKTRKFVDSMGNETERIIEAPDCIATIQKNLNHLLKGFALPWNQKRFDFIQNKDFYIIGREESKVVFKRLNNEI